jgi:flagellar biosynthetic protein FliQ
MDGELVLYIARRSLETGLMLLAPVLCVTLVIGFGTAILQAVTSIRDMTMGTVLKLACIGITLLLSGNWMIQVTVGFTNEIFGMIQTVAR